MRLPNCAIPLYVPKESGTIPIGTGFLARRRDEVGLVTAARVPLGRQPFATSGWVGWPAQILAVPDPSEEPLAIELFSANGRGEPAFAYALANPASGYLRDLITFSGSVNAEALVELEASFEVVDLDGDAPSLSAGTVVTVLGYPDRGGASKWPYRSPRKLSGPVADTGNRVIEASFTAPAGFAGSPAFADDGRFAGMVTGPIDARARIHPAQELLSL